jgi:hypothetical protein
LLHREECNKTNERIAHKKAVVLKENVLLVSQLVSQPARLDFCVSAIFKSNINPVNN